jgi:hypothetical protein
MTLYIPPEIIENICLMIGPVALAISKKISKKIVSKLFPLLIMTHAPKTESYSIFALMDRESYSDAYINEKNIFSFTYWFSDFDSDSYFINIKKYKDYSKKHHNFLIQNPVYTSKELNRKAKILEQVFNTTIDIQNIKYSVLTKFKNHCNQIPRKHLSTYLIMIAITLNCNFNGSFLRENKDASDLLFRESQDLKGIVDRDFTKFLDTIL